MALTVDANWFQLRFFTTGNQIIISDQFVSPSCSSVMNFSIVTTSALFCDSMIAEIAQIGDVRKSPAENILSRGFVSLRPLCANFELLRYQRCSFFWCFLKFGAGYSSSATQLRRESAADNPCHSVSLHTASPYQSGIWSPYCSCIICASAVIHFLFVGLL